MGWGRNLDLGGLGTLHLFGIGGTTHDRLGVSVALRTAVGTSCGRCD
jgi:hypothetical protein